MFRRRREKRTDYKQRLALLKSGCVRLVVRRGLRYIHAQLIRYEKNGDKTICEEMSKNLRRYGWKAHCNNLPSAYLTGLLIGFKALKHNIREAILDIGLQSSTKGNAIYALAKGAIDAGLKIPIGKEVLPNEDRIKGKHIADFAKKLKAEPDKYKRQFSYPAEEIQEHFEDVKKNIMNEFKR